MEILEIGARARAALQAASRIEPLMSFAHGHVLRTNLGEIVWCDSRPEAFSPCGLRLPAPSGELETSVAAASACGTMFDAVVDIAIAEFLDLVRNGETFESAATILLGLGPGLTPAGDDFLGGYSAVRARLGHPTSLDTSATHAISAARLAMHVLGEGTRAEMAFIDALLSSADTTAAATVLRRFGHTSGEDFMRGARAAMSIMMVVQHPATNGDRDLRIPARNVNDVA